MFSAVSIVRLELRQQVEQLHAANEDLRSNNEALALDLASLSQAVSDVRSEYLYFILVTYSAVSFRLN